MNGYCRDECYCDHSYGLYPAVEEGGCSTLCSDDHSLTCGGPHTIAVYQVKGQLTSFI